MSGIHHFLVTCYCTSNSSTNERPIPSFRIGNNIAKNVGHRGGGMSKLPMAVNGLKTNNVPKPFSLAKRRRLVGKEYNEKWLRDCRSKLAYASPLTTPREMTVTRPNLWASFEVNLCPSLKRNTSLQRPWNSLNKNGLLARIPREMTPWLTVVRN